MSKLALLGGEKAVKNENKELFAWPIVNQAMKDAAVKVIEDGTASGTNITKVFEKGFAEWHGSKYALAHVNGTAALQAAFYALGVGKGDEIICPSITYWASCVSSMSLGASVVFADIDPDTLCIDPIDIEKRITDRTKIIVVVHYMSMPADMDAIMALAKKYNIKVLEDTSHAHGALYKGKMVGTFGDAAGFSLMNGKSFAISEGGILLTDDREVYERALLWGHYGRHNEIENEQLKQVSGLPHGGCKNRLNQIASAIGIEQLKKYPTEIIEIDKAMNYFLDQLEGLPGIRTHRPAPDSNTTKGGWYACRGLYRPEELGGLSARRFCEAVTAEGVTGVVPGCNKALHSHPLFQSVDIYRDGAPTNLTNLPNGVDVRATDEDLPVSAAIHGRAFGLPWFKHFQPEIIDQYVAAFRKVIENYEELLPGDETVIETGAWGLTKRK
ncbi:MAG: DegT/DnrJ/EryC1/StrS family aminotransferase [Victivallaceae bacterium]|nr:DegT/DnrJ/EryC1/StrS family aminotransferase [Victivallaceae bacterium]